MLKSDRKWPKKKKKSTGKARAMKYDTPYLVYTLEIVPTVIH